MRLKDFTEAGQARGLLASLLVTLLAVILQANVTLAHTQQSNCKHKYPKVDDELHHVSLEVVSNLRMKSNMLFLQNSHVVNAYRKTIFIELTE